MVARPCGSIDDDGGIWDHLHMMMIACLPKCPASSSTKQTRGGYNSVNTAALIPFRNT